MKVLQLIHSSAAERGGLAEAALLLRGQLQSHGHSLVQVTLDDPRHRAPDSDDVALGPGVGNYGLSLRFRAWLARHASSFDIVVIQGLWQFHLAGAVGELRRHNIPYVVFCHGMLDPWFKTAYPLKHFKKQLYWWLLEYRALRDARVVIFTCEEERMLARQSFTPYRVNEYVLGYGTLAPDIDVAACQETFLSQFPQLRGKRILLFLGRLHEKKGCDLLIEAFARVSGEHPDLHLVMAGPDETALLPTLQKQARVLGCDERLSWVGMLRGTLKWGALACADVFSLPSHQENFGIAVAEALVMGLPVLISNKVNIWREVEQGGAGLIAADTLQGTEDTLRRWLSLDSTQQQRMRDNARACFARHFDFNAMGLRFHELITDVVADRCKPAQIQSYQSP